MKSLIIISAFMCFGYTFGQSYNTALGVKFGYPTWASLNVKHFFGGSANAIDASFGAGGHHLWLGAMYERNQSLGGVSGLEWYWGLGGDLGFWTNNYQYYNSKNNKSYGGIWLGADAAIGLEYTIDAIPLNFALEVGPTLRLYPYVGVGVNSAFAIRYAIK